MILCFIHITHHTCMHLKLNIDYNVKMLTLSFSLTVFTSTFGVPHKVNNNNGFALQRTKQKTKLRLTSVNQLYDQNTGIYPMGMCLFWKVGKLRLHVFTLHCRWTHTVDVSALSVSPKNDFFYEFDMIAILGGKHQRLRKESLALCWLYNKPPPVSIIYLQ